MVIKPLFHQDNINGGNIMDTQKVIVLNMLRDPVDGYIEHKDEIEEILKPFITVSQVSPINQEMYISSNWQD